MAMRRIWIGSTDLSNVFQICSRNGVQALIVEEVIIGWLGNRRPRGRDPAVAPYWH